MNAPEKKALKRTLVYKRQVLIERRVRHPLYGKIIVRSNKYHAHNEGNVAKSGDTVEIQEGRPISRTKSWTVTRVVQQAQAV